MNLATTGVTSLHIFESSITGLEIGDEIGLFDLEGIINYNDCTNQIGELLVAAEIWTGSQANIVSIGSVDQCAFGGAQLSGYVDGNQVVARVYRPSTGEEFSADLTFSTGVGLYGEIIQAISEVVLTDLDACEDDDETTADLGGCIGAVAALGCNFVFSGLPISDWCPVTCDACPEVTVLGCTDSSACNYEADATEDDGSCLQLSDWCTDSDGDGLGDPPTLENSCGAPNFFAVEDCTDLDDSVSCASNVIDECGICDGTGIPDSDCDCNGNVLDCAGVCGGDTVIDCTGACGGDAMVDCLGVCDGTAILDCLGVCGGDAMVDCTGSYCGLSTDVDWSDLDCLGVCGGTAVEDCLGVCDGVAVIDECGVCDGIGIPNGDCDCNGNITDCAGVCGGDAILDECGECNGDGSSCNNELLDYSENIQPIFNANCTIYCHSGGGGYTGGLDLTSYENLMQGGNSGPAIFPYYSDYSLIIQKLEGTAPGSQMPSGQNPLDQSLINMIALWIDQGALPPENDEGDAGGGSDLGPLGELDFGIVDPINQTVEVLMDCQYPVSEFNIEVSGIVVNSAFGGDAGELEFNITTTDSTVIGQFSDQGSYIPENNGLLTILEYSEATDSLICFEYSNITTSIGIEYEAILGDCIEVPFSNGPQNIEIPLHYGSNLISFYALPEDRYIGNVMSSLAGNITGVIGEGIAANVLPNGSWVGGLTNISETSGYWVKVVSDDTLTIENAVPLSPNLTYYLHSGTNLISFPSDESVGISESIPDEVEVYFTGIIGEGIAANVLPNGNWVGGLTHFEGGNGYWVKINSDINFNFILEDSQDRSFGDFIENDNLFSEYEYEQSTKQAFYFIKNIVLQGKNIEIGDWVLVYNDDILVGGRQWNGDYTDIPAMGDDGNLGTEGYFQEGDIPKIKVVNSNGEQYTFAKLPPWVNNELYTLDNISITQLIPNEIYINNVYPNPFNPFTTIEFSLPVDSKIQASIYNINGQLIEELSNGFYSAGLHRIVWEATDKPSGIYLVNINDGNNISTQKLILMK